MIDPAKTTQLNDLLPGANSILVAVGTGASLDQVATAIALTESLQQAGKEVHLLSPDEITQTNYPVLIKSELFGTQIGNRDLLVSFNYTPESVDKVSYHIDEQQGKFCLVIKPQKGQKPLSPESVEYSYTGAEADLIFLVGVHDLDSLGNLYYGYETLYQSTTIVTIHSFEPEIGQIKIEASGSSSLSEAIVGLLKGLGLPITPDSATNLISAIEEATQHFQSLSATGTTFGVMGELLQAGGRRLNRGQSMGLPSSTHKLLAKAMELPRLSSSTDKATKTKKTKTAAKSTDSIGSLKYQPSNLATGNRS